ncbi:Interferon-induced GTP-binding protein [Lachnellula subtilissima]|uniref:Interferon-induced GTP-binding protein n=1 Tax=Lachnellula subtilissima TaxID=602034 RepID=A0A8H8S125_9HELO|nr:Interferon-induced GTP-binding protein [Lachnellula subtilissima]
MLAEDRSRLQKIDELYALRLDQYVSLPQLVVVGDQSSGKSSVLEGLTNLPFPRDSGLCTRHPTQIVFNRSKVSMIEASIMQASGQAESTVAALAKFGKRQVTSLDEQSFMNLLALASECMGLPPAGTKRDPEMVSFSDNILKLELSGPEYENFSVVDLPGLFRKPTLGQTTKEDMTLVRGMVARYLSNPRSIILAVVPANVDIATQEIIQMAEDADRNGQRTLGVLTKPDLVDRGAEEKILELVTNQTGRGRLELGYTIVCNRSQSELGATHDERNVREAEFFKSGPWNAVPEKRAGVKALKARLDKLLIDVTRQNFQAVAMDVRDKIRKLEGELDYLGPARETSNDQRNHLIRIASDFRGIAVKAIDAYYGRDQCFEDDDFRLATHVMEMNQNFSETIRLQGFTRSFRRNSDKVAMNRSELEISSSSTPSGSGHSLSSSDVVGSDAYREYSELDSLLHQPSSKPGKAETDIMQWITNKYDRSKGFEIGTLNPSLLPSLFFEQSRSWEYYANCHVKEVIRKIQQFNYKALDYCCRDRILSERLWTKLAQLFLPSYKEALNQVSFLVNIEQSGNLMTLNHYFADNLRKAREDRIKRRLIDLQTWATPDPQKEPLLRLSDTITAFVSNEDHTVLDLHDTLEAYYKVARKRFVDAICLQAVDHCLISSGSGPLWLFSPQYVGQMSTSELTQVAGESDAAAGLRSRLVEEIANLKAGERILED